MYIDSQGIELSKLEKKETLHPLNKQKGRAILQYPLFLRKA